MRDMTVLETTAAAIVSRELATPCQLTDGADDFGTRIVTARIAGRALDIGYQPGPKITATWLAEWVMEVYAEACDACPRSDG
jgi:hypothetical protein